eukprot:364595-Chlamydomonas_euryale.AAC.20
MGGPTGHACMCRHGRTHPARMYVSAWADPPGMHVCVGMGAPNHACVINGACRHGRPNHYSWPGLGHEAAARSAASDAPHAHKRFDGQIERQRAECWRLVSRER